MHRPPTDRQFSALPLLNSGTVFNSRSSSNLLTITANHPDEADE